MNSNQAEEWKEGQGHLCIANRNLDRRAKTQTTPIMTIAEEGEGENDPLRRDGIRRDEIGGEGAGGTTLVRRTGKGRGTEVDPNHLEIM